MLQVSFLIESARLFITMIGTRLAHYEITAHLGSGGMGDVYQATDSKLQFDLANGNFLGNPETLADGVGSNAFFDGGISVSGDGRIAYRAGSGGATQLVWFDQTGKSMGVAGEPDSNSLVAPEVSPDGRRIAFDRTVQSNRDVWRVIVTSG